MVTSHAAAVPTANVSAPTPADSSSVRHSEPGSTVADEVRPDVVGRIDRQQQDRGDGQRDDGQR